MKSASCLLSGLVLIALALSGCTGMKVRSAAFSGSELALAEALKEPQSKDTLNSALKIAINKDHPGVVKGLLAAGAEANLEWDHSAPLIQAVIKGFNGVMAELLNAGADPDLKRGGTTALIEATFRGDLKAIELLMDRSADPDVATARGDTPLHWAAAKNHTEALAYLLKRGANPNRVSETGVSPLTLAVSQNNYESVLALLSHKADPDAVFANGTPVLVEATSNEKIDERIALALLKAGASVEFKQWYPQATLAHALAVRGSEPLAQAFIRSKIPLNEPNKSNITAVAMAYALKHPRVAVALLNAGADPIAGSDLTLSPAFICIDRYEADSCASDFAGSKGWARRIRADRNPAVEYILSGFVNEFGLDGVKKNLDAARINYRRSVELGYGNVVVHEARALEKLGKASEAVPVVQEVAQRGFTGAVQWLRVRGHRVPQPPQQPANPQPQQADGDGDAAWLMIGSALLGAVGNIADAKYGRAPQAYSPPPAAYLDYSGRRSPGYTMCPDSSYVAGGQCTMAPNGSYVGGSTSRIAPDGSYVGGPTSTVAPDGSYVGGSKATICPDGTYVGGSRCVITPNGSYVGAQ